MGYKEGLELLELDNRLKNKKVNKMKKHTVKLICGCVYTVFAEDKGHAECQVDYLHYIDTVRDKIKKCKNKSRYVVLEIENMDNGKSDYVSWDVYLENKEGHEFVAEFQKRSDALLFSRIKNRKRRKK